MSIPSSSSDRNELGTLVEGQAAAGGGSCSQGPAGVPAASGKAGQVQALTHPTDRCVTMTPHWVSVSIRRPLPDVMALVADHFLGAELGQDPVDLFDAAGRSRFYGAIHQAFGGISILSEFTDAKKAHCLVNVPGAALEQLPGGGLHALASFLGTLAELGGPESTPEASDDSEGNVDAPPADGRVFKVTRLDLAFDHVPFTVGHCVEAASVNVPVPAANVRSPVRKGTEFRSLGDREPGEDGDSFTWGARASKSRMVRCYDRRGFVRFEMEWRGDRSDLLARELAGLAPGAWAKRAIAHLRDFIDFIDRTASANVSRCPLLPWWAAFVQGVDRIRVKIDRPARPLVEKVATIVKRVRKHVHKLQTALGREWVDHHLVRMGEFACTPADRREVTELRRLADEDPDAVGLWPSLRRVAAEVVAAICPPIASPPTLRQVQLSW